MDVLNTGYSDPEKNAAGTVAFSVSIITCALQTGETCICSQMRERFAARIERSANYFIWSLDKSSLPGCVYRLRQCAWFLFNYYGRSQGRRRPSALALAPSGLDNLAARPERDQTPGIQV